MKASLNRRLTVYFLIIMALTVVVSVAWNYNSTRESILEMEKTQAEGCANAVSGLLEHYGSALEEDWTSEEYTFLWNAARSYSRAFGQEEIFIYTIDSQSGSYRMLLNADTSDEAVPPALQNADVFPLPVRQLEKAEDALLPGEKQLQRIVWKAQLEPTILWIALSPCPGFRDPVFIGMAYSIDLEEGHILKDFLADILLPIAALGVAFLILNLMIRKRVTAPIRLISGRMKRFARNSSERPEPLDIRNKDEIGEIASSFETMTEEITAYIGNIEKLTQERVQANVQLDVARRIQYGLVPEKTTLSDRTFRISAMTRPAKAVGGDFYDCFRREDGKVCIVIGDVSGKGITGAIFMAVIKTTIREKLTLGLSPAQALNQTNRQMLEQNPEGLFATVFAGVLDPRTGDLLYANAGHTWPVLTGSVPTVLEPEIGIALGLFDDADIREENMKLAPGQGLILYTDGLTDALSAQRVSFGMKRLLRVLQDTPQDADPAEDTLNRISQAVSAFCEGVDPFDDMAVLVLFMTGTAPEEEMRPIPVSLSAFAEIKEAVFAETGDTPAARRALLACDEALSNIVRYSGADRLAFRCSRQGDTLCVVFSDNGIPFDPTEVLTEEKDFEELDGGGMGLNLIRQSASSLSYERREGMNVFTLFFPV